MFLSNHYNHSISSLDYTVHLGCFDTPLNLNVLSCLVQVRIQEGFCEGWGRGGGADLIILPYLLYFFGQTGEQTV